MPRALRALLALAVAAALVPAAAAAAQGGAAAAAQAPVDAGPPLRFAPRGLTTDRFPVATEPERVDVPAHDGVQLHARVYRPDTSSDPGWRTPVILVHSPYYDGLVLGDAERSMDLVERFTPKGYTVVLSSLRGTGNSGGCGEQDGADQARDFKTLVEYFAAQPWSNGRVGSYGKSYDAETQNAGAVLDPQGLETMVTVAGISGLYDVAYFDGVPLTGRGALSAAAYGLYDVDVPGDPGYLPRRAERHVCQPENVVNGADPRGDMTGYWAEREFRPRVDDITASVLTVQGLSDTTVTPIALDGWYDEIPTFKRAILGQWQHAYPYDAPDAIARDDWYDAVHAWFDAELLDLDTGIEDWPEVQVQSEDNVWRAVGSFRGMGTERVLPLGADGAAPATFTEDGEATWTFGPYADGLHLSGQAYLDAVIALDRPDGHFAVTLQEVREDGSARTLTRGYLSAPHRESLVRQVPVQPGHPTPYRIRTYPFDRTLAPGSSLRLVLSGSDGSTLPAATGYTATVATDRSVLRIPIADERCGLEVAQREAPGGPIPGCPGGVPEPTPWTEVPRSFGHDATVRVVARAEEQIAGVPAVRETGYLLVRDGVELAVEVVRPAGDGPFPTLLTYDGYDAGSNPDSGYAARYLPRGYALVGLSLRGTGCSGGVFDFFQPAEGWDGYEAVEWIARQPWSTGRVGMVGKSYPGITQLFVAATRPPSLAAIAPGHVFADVYRDIAFPGGIFNYSFAALWSFAAQPLPGYQAAGGALANDPTCRAHQRHHAENVPTNPFLQTQEHPYDDLLIRERSPLYRLDRIGVPVYTASAWQDEQLMSRQTHLLTRLDELGVPYRAVLSNGDHGTYREEPQLRELDRFFEAQVEGRAVLRDGTPRDRYLAEPPVTVLWEQGEDTAPRWATQLRSWGDQATPLRLHLGAEGTMTSEAPAAPGTATYAHTPAGSQGIAGSDTPGPASPAPQPSMWQTYAPPEGAALAFTSAPFAADTTLLGPASADLWVTATAPNVDLQVTLTELRPDGTEVFVNQGWLRAEQRALDVSESSELLPVASHFVADVEALSPTEPSLVRVEVLPFGHLVREGSRVRVWVEAPTVLPQLQGFALDPTPAAVTVHTGPATPSSLVLPVAEGLPVPAEVAGQEGQPACGVVQRMPCRPDPLAAGLPGPPLG